MLLAMVDLQFELCHNVWSAIWTFTHSCWLQGSRIVQRYIDHKKLQRLMKDISGFTASQRMEPGQPMTSIDPKQVHCQPAMKTSCRLAFAYFFVAPVCPLNSSPIIMPLLTCCKKQWLALWP